VSKWQPATPQLLMLSAVWGSGSSPAKSYSKDSPREVSVGQFFRILGDVFSLRCTEPANPLENQLVYRSAAFRYCGFLMNLAKRRNQDQHVSPGADLGTRINLKVVRDA
jgi:hypothetical protein